MASLQRALARAPHVQPAELTAWFDDIADAVLRRSELVVAGQRFALLEVEFYWSRADHPDPYVHRAPAQCDTNGEWYFHRESAARIGFTLKGLDVTFGVPGVAAGGMLARALMSPELGHIDGPSLVVDSILRAANVVSVLALKQQAGFASGAFAAGSLMHFVERVTPLSMPIHIGPRIGLSARNPPFQGAPYRYRARPELTKKDKRRLLAGRVMQAPRPPQPATAPTVAPALSDADICAILGISETDPSSPAAATHP